MEANKEEGMEASCNPAMASTSGLRVTRFFPLQNLKCSRPAITPTTHVMLLGEKSADEEEGVNGEDPDGIEV